MRLLLLNNNPAVSRLIRLSVEKVGYHLDEYNDYALVPLQKFDLILVDNDTYHESEFKALCEQSECRYSIYIGQRGHTKPESTNVLLEKPFLPTDFLGLLDKVKNVLSSFKAETKTETIDLSEETPLEEESMKAFDIDSLESLPTELFEEDEYDDTPEADDKSLSLDDLPETLDLLGETTSDVMFASNDFEKEEDVTLPAFETEPEEETLDISFAPSVDTFDVEEEISASILDKDDINEVKLLLDESDDAPLSFEEEPETEEKEVLENEDDLTLDLESSDALAVEEEETVALVVDEDELLDNAMELSFDEPENEEVSADATPAVLFTDSTIEQIQTISEAKPMVFDSLDTLNENAIKRAFGEEVEDEVVLPTQTVAQDTNSLKNEVEQAITQSLAQLTQSEHLREALKGMRVNVSITFEEV